MKNKKHTKTIALLLLITLLVTFCPITSLAEGGGTLEAVYWDITAGNDNNAGDSSNPVKTFTKARELLTVNGTIYLVNGGTLGAEMETWSLPSDDYGSAKVVVISNGFGTPIDIPANKTLLLENLVIEGAESSSFTKNIFNINKGYCTLTLGKDVVIQNISSTKSLVYAMVPTTNPMVILNGAEIKDVSFSEGVFWVAHMPTANLDAKQLQIKQGTVSTLNSTPAVSIFAYAQCNWEIKPTSYLNLGPVKLNMNGGSLTVSAGDDLSLDSVTKNNSPWNADANGERKVSISAAGILVETLSVTVKEASDEGVYTNGGLTVSGKTDENGAISVDEETGVFTIESTKAGYVIDEITIMEKSGGPEKIPNVQGQTRHTIDVSDWEDGEYEISATFAYTLSFSEMSNGTLTVTREGTALESGSIIWPGDELAISIEPRNKYYALTSLTLNETDVKGGTEQNESTFVYTYAYTVGENSEAAKGGLTIVAAIAVSGDTKVESVTIDEDELSLRAGATANLTAEVLPEESANQDIIWSSSDESVASVMQDGLVFALSVGEAIITATAADDTNDAYAECKVTVTSNDDFIFNINNLDDFEAFMDAVDGGNSYAGWIVQLNSDIDVSSLCSDAMSWPTIGRNSFKEFSGVFEGNDHTISGLYYYNAVKEAGGAISLFYKLKNAVVRNLTVDGTGFSSRGYVAGISVYAESSIILDCINRINLGALVATAGGIAADVSGGTVIDSCENYGDVKRFGGGYAGALGGIAGHVGGGSTIRNCINEGEIISGSTTGGIASSVSGASVIEGCVNAGHVSSYTGTAGGIADGLSGGSSIINCYNTGNVSATFSTTANNPKAAGIAISSDGIVENCYNTGSVSATVNNTSGVARFFPIAGNTDTSGNLASPTVTNCYYLDTSVASNTLLDTTYGTSKTSVELKALAEVLGVSYVNDSFAINSGYPILKWQAENQNADYRITLAHNATAEYGLTVLAAGTKVENGEHFYSGKGGTGLTLTMSKKYTVKEITVGNGTVTLVSSEISGETGVYIYRLSGVSAQSTLTITLKEQDKNIGEDGSPIVSDVSESEVWNGTDVNVCWYFGNENADSYTINTAAELAGVAALVNGLVNEDCIVYVSDSESYSAADWNTSSYAKSSSGEDSGDQGSNQSTDTYYYGIENFEGKTIILGDNIDMGGVYSYGSWYGPNYMTLGGQYLMTDEDTNTKIGSSFCGTFDGNGHYVYNIYCDRHCSGNYGDGQSVGLIGRLGVHDNDPVDLRPLNPSVRNVAITGYIYANRSVGGIVGKIGKTEANNSDNNDDGGIIKNCANFAIVKNTDAKGCGGIVGAGWNGGKVVNCYNASNITSTYGCPTAGISGSNEIVLQNCYNIGTISAATDSFAMAIGTNNGGAPYNDSVINCWYLEGSAPGGGYFDRSASNNENAQTSEEMKSEDFLAQLGSAFAGDINNINNGYPILAWQTATAPKTYSVIVDNAISGGTVTAEPAGGIEGTVVTVTVTPDFGKQLVTGSLKYTTDSGSTYTTITAIKGVYSFILPAADVVITTEFTAIETQPVYTIVPQANEAYSIGETGDGLSIMTVNTGFSGMKYFSIEITPIIGHEGLETVVFVHSENGVQRSINATRADFDTVQFAQAGFNVNPGDVVKVFIVDELTNATDHNPIVLQ